MDGRRLACQSQNPAYRSARPHRASDLQKQDQRGLLRLYRGHFLSDGRPLWLIAVADCYRGGGLHAPAQSCVDQGTTAAVLIAHQVAVGVPGLDGRLVAEERLQDLDRLSATDLDRGEVVTQGMGRVIGRVLHDAMDLQLHINAGMDWS